MLGQRTAGPFLAVVRDDHDLPGRDEDVDGGRDRQRHHIKRPKHGDGVQLNPHPAQRADARNGGKDDDDQNRKDAKKAHQRKADNDQDHQEHRRRQR